MRCLQTIILFLSAAFCMPLAAQSTFSGGLQLNNSFYIADEEIEAVNTPHYDNLLSSTDGWLSLDYYNQPWELDMGIRLDMFLNSNLHNPGIPFTRVGLGRWYVRKRISDLTITGGYIYDQFGTGITFRAYEDRALGIDNAIFGVHVEYELFEKYRFKAFAGLQKDLFELHNPVIKGINLESNYQIGDKLQLLPGVALVNRTIDQASMDFIVNTIESYEPAMRFVPKYNVFVYSVYNRLNFGRFSWYAEYARKTHEAIVDKQGILKDSDGSVIFSTLNYSQKGLGIGLQFKRTENFTFRTSPNEILLDGVINFIPSITKQHSLRLLSRYVAATQELEELGAGLNVTYTPVKGYTINASLSDVRDFGSTSADELDDVVYFREIFAEVEVKTQREWRLVGGLQRVWYNQKFYEAKSLPDEDTLVTTYTPYAEFTWKLNRKHSLRFEYQHMFTGQDFGSWMYGLIEFNIAPKFSFSVSDMYNNKPHKTADKIHYYSIYAAYIHGASRFSLSYVKQVEGIICTGGVCRFEPAFSGFRFSLTSTF